MIAYYFSFAIQNARRINHTVRVLILTKVCDISCQRIHKPHAQPVGISSIGRHGGGQVLINVEKGVRSETAINSDWRACNCK